MKTSSDNYVRGKIIETAMRMLDSGQTLDILRLASEAGADLNDVIDAVEPFISRGLPPQSLKVLLGVEAIRLGIEPQRVAQLLSWKELEAFVATVCRLSGLSYRTNVRLSYLGRRAEIDVLSAYPSLCLVIDCKRWNKRLSGKSLRSIIDKAKQRTYLTKAFFEKKYAGDYLIFFAPVVVSLYEPASRKVDDVFVVPVNVLRTFIASAENILTGSVFAAKLKPDWLRFFEDDNLNQSLDIWR
ncbi:MAG: nuclease-related domain-containing protein [Candidatus Caldarchaeum sp.]|nr:NERD domain-containing protein [Candidatus Caldarchaeum sp.]MCS7133307.1 NERD domain-containing protein [Candidatus Caldarchaeum sp.]MCX8201294.1 NERD domain-containing protein [Candidatus Caldarchaeum sp.]MDW8062641.1 nuclease-related domain-containing protein [Candidatus Caldarchaeum sp.]MDW8436218.1 nuclease-related domain-containing protein [Candidatus Caldarchaeum sp.]